MKEIEAWDLLHGNGCEKKSLSSLIEEMGFSKDSFMVITKGGPRLKVGDTQVDKYGNLMEDPYLSFGTNHLHPGDENLKYRGIYDDFGAIDKKMGDYSLERNGGQCVNGMTGSNNGVYSAMAYGGNEFIITKDREIIEQLERQLSFIPDQLGVPLSNGGRLLDASQQAEWGRVNYVCKLKEKDNLMGKKHEIKSIKSPFRNEYGEITAGYKQYRADRLER